ncbi:hypothetical protein LMA02_22720 [Burkholderia sp. B21-005]|nr:MULTISPECIES: hypothetical protein [unclassified Burkholderia]UEP31870.1 hypothetical protein LMA01_22060 [Burkholderia sp. B21-007]UEP45542.1 hypothetical protein LMA02_22720 [Burkholderia sp. B21-005]
MQGTYRLALLDLEHPKAPCTRLRGLPDCIGILSPDFPADEQRLEAQVEWIARVFGDRAWVALTLHARAMDDISDSGYVACLKRFIETILDCHDAPTSVPWSDADWRRLVRFSLEG